MAKMGSHKVSAWAKVVTDKDLSYESSHTLNEKKKLARAESLLSLIGLSSEIFLLDKSCLEDWNKKEDPLPLLFYWNV